MSRNVYEEYAAQIGKEELTIEEKRLALNLGTIRSVRMDWTKEPWVGNMISHHLKQIEFWLREAGHRMDDGQMELLERIMEVANENRRGVEEGGVGGTGSNV